MQRKWLKAVATLVLFSLSSACTSAAHFKRDELKKLDGMTFEDDHARPVQGLPPTTRQLVDDDGRPLDFKLMTPLTVVRLNGESTTARFDSIQVNAERFLGKGSGTFVQVPMEAISHAEAPQFSPWKTAGLVTVIAAVMVPTILFAVAMYRCDQSGPHTCFE